MAETAPVARKTNADGSRRCEHAKGVTGGGLSFYTGVRQCDFKAKFETSQGHGLCGTHARLARLSGRYGLLTFHQATTYNYYTNEPKVNWDRGEERVAFDGVLKEVA